MRSLHRAPGRRRGLTGAAITLILSVSVLSAQAATVHPLLRSWAAKGDPSRSVSIWVFFADRGFRSESEHRAALACAQGRIGEAALARRARVGASLADDADLPVARAYRDALARFGVIRHESRWLNAVSLAVALGKIDEISRLPFVSDIRPVARGRRSGLGPEYAPDGRLLERPDPTRVQGPPREPRDQFYGPSYDQLDEIRVIEPHAMGYSGARVILMMLDTGFRKDHQAFAASRILAEHDYVFGDGNTQNEPADDPSQHWHGTATWSTCGGFAPGSIIGPAYRATFILAKTEDIRSEFPIEEDNYVAALEWGDSLGVMVTSASLIYLGFDDGTSWTYEQLDGDTAPITRAIDRAAARGILCVNAMGNMGPDPGTLGEPADADTMLACGAVSSENSIANFSSRGPTVDQRTKPEVVARGVDTWCADASGTDTYTTASGTSLSTPLVGGACAVVQEAHPEWSAFRARAALMMTADRANHPDNDYGSGRIDVWAAIHNALIVVPIPFSLVSPADSESLADACPTFLWDRSRDVQGGSIAYELWIDEQSDFGTPIVYADLSDTTFTVSNPLAARTTYYWRVVAEEPHGYRRLSREDWRFQTPEASGVADLSVAGGGWRLESAPNPWRPGSALRWYAPPGSYRREARLTILDPTGRRLVRERVIVSREGWNEWRWNPYMVEGGNLPSGVYLAMLETSGHTAMTRIVFVR